MVLLDNVLDGFKNRGEFGIGALDLKVSIASFLIGLDEKSLNDFIVSCKVSRRQKANATLLLVFLDQCASLAIAFDLFELSIKLFF